MKKFIYLIALVFLSNCSTHERQNERAIKHLKDNFSYDWPRTQPTDEQLFFSEQFYETELEGGDQLVFKRAYMVTFEQTNYDVVEFDFQVALDGRLLIVFNGETGDFIGYFERSLA